MPPISAITEMQSVYRALPFDEIEAAYQIAQAERIEVKRRKRDGLATAGELRDAELDFHALRGLCEQIKRYGRLL